MASTVINQAENLIDKAENKASEIKESVETTVKKVTPQFTSHTGLGVKLPSISNTINPLKSTDLSSLSAINPKAVQYYSALLLNSGYDTNSEQYQAFMEILKAENLNHLISEKFEQDRMDLAGNLSYWLSEFERKNGAKNSTAKAKNLCKAISKLNVKLKESPIAKGYKFKVRLPEGIVDPEAVCKPTGPTQNLVNNFDGEGTNKYNDENVEYRIKYKGIDGKDKIQNIQGETENYTSEGLIERKPIKLVGGGKYVGGATNYYKKALTDLSIAEANKDDDMIKTTIKSIENHPIYSPKFEELFISDRLTMVVIAFILRNLTLFLVEWGINSAFINSFKSAFTYFLLIYSLLFLLIVCAVNNNVITNLSLKLLIYYLNTEANGNIRIILHLMVLYLLYPIVFILKNKNPSNAILTYDQRMNVKSVLETITFITWIMQSVIILRF